MKQEVKVPEIGESITGGILTAWLRESGEQVNEGDDLFELETDKATLSVPSPYTGVLVVEVSPDSEVEVGQVVAYLDTEAVAKEAPAMADSSGDELAPSEQASAKPPAETAVTKPEEPAQPALSPAVRRIVEEHELDVGSLKGTGPKGRITKADALRGIEKSKQTGPEVHSPASVESPRRVTREKMSNLRKRIAERLVQVKQTTALLTTFNEIDMTRVMAIRGKYKDSFQETHGVRLGFMSFFVKACCSALTTFPAVNAYLEEDEIVYHHYCDVGVAVSTDRGLIVPVIRDAETKSFAQIESEIRSFAQRAAEKKITVDELTGGTFSITNGGVFGSLLSTPILNPPQTAILGMHAIQKRPVAVNDNIEIRPMMYVALSYDHRVIDGREAVSYLKKVKTAVEDPEELLLSL